MKLWFVALICALLALPVYGLLRLFGSSATYSSVVRTVAEGVGTIFLACCMAFVLGFFWVSVRRPRS
jgi:hypothetical protein